MDSRILSPTSSSAVADDKVDVPPLSPIGGRKTSDRWKDRTRRMQSSTAAPPPSTSPDPPPRITYRDTWDRTASRSTRALPRSGSPFALPSSSGCLSPGEEDGDDDDEGDPKVTARSSYVHREMSSRDIALSLFAYLTLAAL